MKPMWAVVSGGEIDSIWPRRIQAEVQAANYTRPETTVVVEVLVSSVNRDGETVPAAP